MKGHVFYTGDKAKNMAMKFAQTNNMQTIDMTEIGIATSSWCEQIIRFRKNFCLKLLVFYMQLSIRL